ncbi:hypothetical protein [Barrientosiimonas endolithica]|uniref:Uncharacterized protein n=1 Tax=Barrientosiimonas endolithica TaxID=1535208 RepID=A0ABM8H9A1_9MICO|nr:hypothetical protein [Barrientosiimonas endolithica]BDZ57449.1 hypothetical protein GCM10025872_11060 [Barrientosiimonas endolithica]
MSSIEHTATPPDQPITTQLTHAAANARNAGNGGDGAGASATAQPGAGAALLGQVRDTLTALRAAPRCCTSSARTTWSTSAGPRSP